MKKNEQNNALPKNKAVGFRLVFFQRKKIRGYRRRSRFLKNQKEKLKLKEATIMTNNNHYKTVKKK